MDRRKMMLAALGAALCPLPSTAGEDAAKIRDLYARDGSFSEFALGHADKLVTFEGYMAPPLKAASAFFVLTKMPMSVCPFCETEAEWPDDILAVYAQRIVDVVPFNVRIRTRGRLRLGSFRDPETGFVSLARLENATFKRG